MDIKIAGKIISAIGLLSIFPSEEKVGEYLSSLLKTIPGCENASLCLRSVPYPAGGTIEGQCLECTWKRKRNDTNDYYPCELDGFKNTYSYPLDTGTHFYGHLILEISDGREYGQYESFVENLAHALMVSLENRRQQRELREAYALIEKQMSKRVVDFNESEAKYRNLFNAMDEGFCIIEMIFNDMGKPIDYRFVETNDAFEKQTGLVAAKGKLARDLIPNLEPYWIEIYSKVAVTGDSARFVNEAKGLNRFYDVYCYRIGLPEQRQVAVIFNDISKQRSEEEALKKSQRLLAEAERIGHVGGWEFNIDTLEQNWTDEVYRIHEVDTFYKPNVEKVINFYTPESKPMIEQALKRAIEFGEPFALDLEIITAKGNHRWVQAIGKADLERKRIVGSFLDITERKRSEQSLRESEQSLRESEQSLRESEQLYALLIDSIPNTSIHLVDKDLRYRITGGSELVKNKFAKAQVEGRLLREAFPKEIADLFEPLFRKAFEGESIKFEMPYGSYEYLQQVLPVRNQEGNIFAAIHISTNITERKKNEEALKQSRRFTQSIIDNSPLLIYVLDREGRIILVNKAFTSLIKLDTDQVIGKTREQIGLPKEIAEEHRKNDLEVMHSLRAVEFEEINLEDDEEHVYISQKFPLIDMDGTVNGVCGISIDITSRRRMEVKLREREALLNTIIESLPIGLWITDEKGKIIQGNQASQRLWAGVKYVGIEQFGEYKGWWANTGKRIEASEWAASRAIQKGETSIEEEVDIECFDGTRKTILNSALPLKNEKNEIIGAIAINQDITTRKKVETRINEQLTELLRWQKVTIDRESRIIEVKKEVNELLARLGEPPRYPSAIPEEKRRDTP